MSAPTDSPTKFSRKDFQSDQEVRWCPGCGDYSILAQTQATMPSLGVAPHNVVFISGIGCAARFPYYMETYGFHSIHGRALAVASGAKITNPKLKIFVISGDGDGLSIGGNHFLHALRRNLDITYVLFNNQIYGLTKGQYSPTSEKGKKTKSSPFGSVEDPIHPLCLALAAESSFVARSIDTDTKHLAQVVERASRHKGTSFVEVYQNCIIFNDKTFAPLSDREQKAETCLYLEHGKPLLFGADRKKGIRVASGGLAPEIVTLGENGVTEADILVHDENGSPQYAEMLARMWAPEWPVPMGVIHAHERPTFEENLYAQIEDAKKRLGPGSLQKMLEEGDVWEVA